MNVHAPLKSVTYSPKLHYSTVAIVLHWTIAAAIIAQLGLGWRLEDLEGPARSLFLQIHKTVGISVLVLTVARLAWRYMNPPPAPDAKLDALESKLAHAVHMGFYAALFLLPLTGWAASSLERTGGLKLIAGIKWPDFPGVSLIPGPVQETLSSLSLNAHGLLVWVMLALLALHIAGALKHQFISKDNTLARMAPGAKPGDFTEPRLLAIPVVAAMLAAIVYLPPPIQAKPRPHPASLAQADVYLDIVSPALERRCSMCHSDDQSKGGLSVTSYESLMHGGRDGAVIKPGDHKNSELITRVHLKPDDKKYMPQGEKPPLSASQIAAIELWIDKGAPHGVKVGAMKLTDAQKAVFQAALPQDENAEGGNGAISAGGEFAGLPKVAAGDPATIKALESTGFIVRPISADSNLLDVGFTVKRDLNATDIANLKKIGQQIFRLNLHWSGLTDAQLKEVATFANLRQLKLDNDPVTDAGVASLASLKSLENLSLTGTKITDASLNTVAGFPKIEKLYTWGSAVTPPAVQKLKAAKPNLSIDGGLTRADVPPPGPLMQPVN